MSFDKIPFNMGRLFFFVYGFLSYFFLALYLPVLIYSVLFKGKYRKSLPGRFGFELPFIPETEEDTRRIWIHAASVGETLSIKEFLFELRKKRKFFIILSTVTEAGNRIAKEKLSGLVDEIRFLPFDLPYLMRRFIKACRAEMLIIVETELWPSLIVEAKKAGMKLVLLNGRIGDRSFKRYSMLRFFISELMGFFDLIFPQSEEDRRRLLYLGAREEITFCQGNIKFDALQNLALTVEPSGIRRKFGFEENDRVVVFGSVHPGEDTIVVDAAKKILSEEPDTKFILAPRKFDRLDETLKVLEKSGISCARRTSEGQIGGHSLLLLDTVGELLGAYSIATVAFVGGSLVPAGGHNLLEPAIFGKVPVSGPYTFNFRDIVSLFERAGALIVVRNSEELAGVFLELLRDIDKREKLGFEARKIAVENTGCSRKTAGIILEFLDKNN